MNPSICEILDVTSNNKNRLLQLANQFNQISGSDRRLIPDFLDCGTTARAGFMHLIHFHRWPCYPCFEDWEKERIFLDYRPVHRSLNNQKLMNAQKILSEMNDGIMIMTLRFWYDREPDQTPMISKKSMTGKRKINNLRQETQFGHVWLIEKKEDEYYIYQSSLNEYRMIDYFNEKGAAMPESGPRFLEHLRPLINTNIWSDRNIWLFNKYFNFYPRNIPIGIEVFPEFFYAYLEY